MECAKALEFCMRLAKEKGLYAENFDDYGVEIRLYEKPRKKRLLLAAHTDVVPPSGENTYPPFGGTVDRGYIIGRGSVDDKGPLMALLYALFFFKETGISPECDLRLFVGAHEEVDRKDIEYYLEKAGQPDFGIAADDDFPITNGEKHILWFRLKAERSCMDLWQELEADSQGIQFGIHSRSKRYGESRCKLRAKNERWAEFDARFPVSIPIARGKENIEKFAGEHAMQVEFLKEEEGYYISEKDGIPNLLLRLYREETGCEDAAYIMEGSTYARKFQIGCGYGAGKRNEKKPFPYGAGAAHGPDEAQNIDVLMQALKMYILAVMEIDEYWKRQS